MMYLFKSTVDIMLNLHLFLAEDGVVLVCVRGIFNLNTTLRRTPLRLHQRQHVGQSKLTWGNFDCTFRCVVALKSKFVCLYFDD